MRILALVTDAFGGFGGIAQYNRDFLTACAQSASDTAIVVLPRHGVASAQDLPPNVTQLPPAAARLAYVARALRAVAKHHPFDIVFCGHLFTAPLAAWVAKVSKARLWLQLHGIEAWQPPRRLVRYAAERADSVTVVSRYTRQRFLSWANMPPARVRVLPCTVSGRFTPGLKPGEIASRQHLVGKKVLLTVGRLAPTEQYKGHDRVIRVLPEILTIHRDVVYAIAGDGDDRERLEHLARDQGVQEAVRFLGRVDDTELADLYRLADLFVMPSTGEGFGIVFLEAAASGVPIVAGHRDGSVDPLRDGLAGLLVDPDDPDQLIHCITTALNHRMPEPTQVVAAFTFEHFRRHCAALLDEITGGRALTSA